MTNSFRIYLILVLRVQRGCLSDLIDYDAVSCLKGSIDEKQCRVCYEDTCNKKIKPAECVKCDSRTDENCLKNPESYKSLECGYYTDSCVALMRKDNTIIRDCVRAIEQADATGGEDVREFCKKNPWSCSICDDVDGCNKQTKSGYCYECNSIDDPNCWRTLTDDMLTQCPFSVTRSGCYHYTRESGEYQLLI